MIVNLYLHFTPNSLYSENINHTTKGEATIENMTKKKIILIHWKPEEAQERIEFLKNNGYAVTFEPFKGPATLRAWREHPPDVFLIDLSRSPSMGRDVAVALRQYKGMRNIPLVFAGGAPEKVEKVKKLLPDALYCDWHDCISVLKLAIENPPQNAVKPESALAGYAGTPLPKKLGIKDNSVVSCINAPDDLVQIMSDLPQGAALRYNPKEMSGLLIWFVRSVEELEQQMVAIAPHVNKEGIWIAWAKKSSALYNGVTQAEVRRIGLAAGLVDYKICAINDTWSALRFAKRK
jgi:CheY-like chemotaxis protein